MPNESLVATVYHKGLSVGTGNLTIEDTSTYPKYLFELVDANNSATAYPLNLNQLDNYEIRLQQGEAVKHASKVYVTIDSPDGKFLSQADAEVGRRMTSDAILDIDGAGKGKLSINTDYFPSLTGYSGSVYFFYDAARTLLIRKINLEVLPLSTAKLTVSPQRNMTGDQTYPSNVEMGELFVVEVEATGSRGDNANYNTKYLGDVDGNSFLFSDNISTSPTMTLGVKPNGKGSELVGTVTNPADKTDKLIKVKMGEVNGSRLLKFENRITGISWLNTSNPQSIPLLRKEKLLTGATAADYVFAVAQGGSISNTNPQQIRKGPSVFDLTTPKPNISIRSLTALKTSTDYTLWSRPYLGELSALAWKPELLVNADTRHQFGKYQNSFRLQVSGTGIIKWSDLADSVADNLYGVLSPTSNDLVLLVSSIEDRADFVDLKFLTTDNKDIEVHMASLTEAGNARRYEGGIHVLALRKSEMLNTYPDWVPYPRIIKADIAVGTVEQNWPNAKWQITIPDVGIDLRDPRYQIQYTSKRKAGTPNWLDATIQRTQLTMSIVGTSENVSPDPKYFAIWDMGPNSFETLPQPYAIKVNVKRLDDSPYDWWMFGAGKRGTWNMDPDRPSILDDFTYIGKDGLMPAKLNFIGAGYDLYPVEARISLVTLTFLQQDETTEDNLRTKPNQICVRVNNNWYRLERDLVLNPTQAYQDYMIKGNANDPAVLAWFNDLNGLAHYTITRSELVVMAL